MKRSRSPFATVFRARGGREAAGGVSVRHHADGVWSVIEISGEMDMQVWPLMPELHGAAATHVVFDLERVTFIDGAGLGVIVQCHRRARAGGGEVRLAALSRQVRRLVALTDLDRVLTIYASVDQATSASVRPDLRRGS